MSLISRTSVNIARLIKDIKQNGKKPEGFYAIEVDPVSKDNLPYKGCPAEKANKPFGY